MTYGTLPPGGYPATSKWLHWLIAICVLAIVPIGLLLPYTEAGPFQDRLYNIHKSLGVLILALMLLRLINRLVVGSPAPEPSLATWQRTASSAVHGLLYVLLIAQPIIGNAANSAYGASTPFFGLFELQPIVTQNEALSKALFAVHRWLGILIAALVLVHIGAALLHHLIIKDGVLRRMLPRALGGR